MKKAIIGLLATSALLMACNSKINRGNNKETFSALFKKIYNTDNIERQTFTIDNTIDNIINGKSGTNIRIGKNTFVDETGSPISGNVEFELKEAFAPLDIALGNLTTTFNGKALETGGMIYLNAKSNSKNLSIAKDKEILVGMPQDSSQFGMSLFSGEEDSLGVKWNNPRLVDAGRRLDFFEKSSNVVTYEVDGFANGINQPIEINNEVHRIAWAGEGLKIKKDSTFKLGKYTIRFHKQEKLIMWSKEPDNEKGRNSFAEDTKINYIFSVKKLGWANIDRLLDDPRTKEVELITSIENQKEFEAIYVTMITKNMYLPGYQKKDETFCFSHNDEETQKLPVGETATILATAYKNGTPYFAIRKISIAEKQTLSLKLDETTMEKLKVELRENI